MRVVDNSWHDSHRFQHTDTPFVVLDDDDVGSDELNLRSGTRLPSSSKRFTLVSDGDTYTEIASVFSDPIEDFPPETSHEKGRGFVSERIHHFENQRGPKINLFKETLKRGMKGKSKVCRIHEGVFCTFNLFSPGKRNILETCSGDSDAKCSTWIWQNTCPIMLCGRTTME